MMSAALLDRLVRKDIDSRIRDLIGVLDAQNLVSEANPIWRNELIEWIRREMELLGLDADTRVVTALAERHLREFGAKRIAGMVNRTTQDVLTDSLAQGLNQGDTRVQLIERVEEVFDGATGWRAENIARTETLRSSNWATTQGHKLAGIDEREWVSVRDGATRDTHRRLDGQIVGIEQKFKIDGYSALYPGDFGDPSMDCACRCITAPVLNEKRLDPDQVWKRFDRRLTQWENASREAFVRGFNKQRKKVLAQLEQSFGSMAA